MFIYIYIYIYARVIFHGFFVDSTPRPARWKLPLRLRWSRPWAPQPAHQWGAKSSISMWLPDGLGYIFEGKGWRLILSASELVKKRLRTTAIYTPFPATWQVGPQIQVGSPPARFIVTKVQSPVVQMQPQPLLPGQSPQGLFGNSLMKFYILFMRVKMRQLNWFWKSF